ncbi:peptidase family C50-domain-containing protein [Phyllosticta citrichinensis]|uniref:separase n=1 Tax=Phyllosticta citrichinensis TaxID=1130410 RepID=A0ABR1XN69_9PEZI
MTATGATSTRPEIDHLKASLASASTCPLTSIASLQELLGASSKSTTPEEKENTEPAECDTTARKTKPSQSRIRSKKTAEKVANAHPAPQLSSYDKFVLATEVVNLSLKSLGEGLKSSSKVPDQSTSGTKQSSHRRDASTASVGSGRNPKNAGSRTGAQRSAAPIRPSHDRQTTQDSASKHPQNSGLVAIAECARLAFAYLRTLEAWKTSGKDMPPLQVESGMLSLVGKMISGGMENLAVKELRILKRRLEGHMRPVEKKGSEPAQEKRQETLASLLQLENVHLQSPVLHLVVQHQLYVLKIIASSRKAATIESSSKYLQLSSQSSPIDLLLSLSERSGYKEKAARQLETISKILLSLCPSILASEDKTACDDSRSPSPETAFRLQSLAFEARIQWWNLSKHRGDHAKDLFDPFSKCLKAFERRCELPANEKHNLAAQMFRRIEAKGKEYSRTHGFEDSFSTRRVLSALAQSAGLNREAVDWMRATDLPQSSPATVSTQLAVLTRITSLSLEDRHSDEGMQKIYANIEAVLNGLNENPDLELTALQSLVTEFSGLRKKAASVCVESADDGILQQKCFSLIVSHARLLSDYISATAEAELLRTEIDSLTKEIKGTMDSVAFGCKALISNRTMTWDSLDQSLQHCISIVAKSEQVYEDDVQGLQELRSYIQHPLVRISGLYWLFSAQLQKSDGLVDGMVRPMQKAVELLLHRPADEMAAGLLILKCQKVGEVLESLRRPEEAEKTFLDSLEAQLRSGVLKAVADRASSISLSQLMEEDQFANLLRTLKALHHLSLRRSHDDNSSPRIIDRDELDIASRGLLLESQLAICCQSHLKNRYPGTLLMTPIRALSKLLFDLYDETAYPLRRQRAATCVLRLGLDGQDLLESSLRYDALQCIVGSQDSLGSDEPLAKYREHYAASHKVAVALLETPPSLDKLQHALRAWQEILDKSGSWKSLLENVDDFDSWSAQLSVLADFFGMRGMDRLRVVTLSISTKALKLQETPNWDSLLWNSTNLAQQFLEFGYSGRAGLVLADAKHAVEAASNNGAVQWHVVYAQYMLALGNGTGCIEALAAAKKLAAKDAGSLASPGTTASFSTRIKHTQLLAIVSLVHSRLSLTAGHPSEALAHAKHCVNLNKKIWMTVENRTASKAATSSQTNDVEEIFHGVKNMSMQSKSPTVISMTHEALKGAQFWPFVSSIFRGLFQLSNVFAHQGKLQEAIFYAEQASKVAGAVDASSLMVASLGLTARFYLDSNRIGDAMDTLAKAATCRTQARPNADLALFHCVAARAHELSDDFQTAVTEFDSALSIISSLIQPDHVKQIERISPDDREIVDMMSKLEIEEPVRRGRRVAAKQTTARKPTKAGATKTADMKKAGTNPLCALSSNPADECQYLQGLQAVILCHKANLFLSKDKLSDAVALISQAEQLSHGLEASVQHQSTRFRSLMSEAMKEIAADFTFNALPESTISFPALSWNERKFSESFQQKPASTSLYSSASGSVGRKGAKGKKVSKEDFSAILQKARDCISEAHTKALGISSTSAVHRVCSMLNEVTILLSATSYRGSRGTLHPLFAAYLTELPKTNAFELEKKAIAIETHQTSRAELMSWPSFIEDAQKPSRLSAAEFQANYVDIIPASWTTISLSLNEAHDELYITRYIANQSPFILRLPLSRHKARDVDEELFGFDEAKAELKEIIDLSDFSVRNTQDLTAKGAKTEWWAQREALDCRLHDLLVNMENIWLGGFRGIFSVKKGDKSLLGRFQKSFQNILDRHLPSRQGKGKQAKKTQLDSRILELFVGLGNPDDGRDLDDSLMDLVYFVVDILQFNGEKNAYDEIDFDAIIIEMLDALRAFHQAADPAPMSRHTILILDKNLHGFPWESLPSLQPLSISRLPSMSALRERLLVVQADAGNETRSMDEVGHHLRCSSLSGTSILNPGGDLKHTQQTLAPHVNDMPGSWLNLINLTPDEKVFESSITEKDLLLFFGHGSGAQYVRGRTVRKLQNSRNQDGSETSSSQKPLATSLLFGCSSAHITENGEFEPSGMLCSYVTAGVPAVMGMLWDVTDKDCDRFAVATLSSWGLFTAPKEGSDGESKTHAKGTSSKREKSKSRAADRENRQRPVSAGAGVVGLDEAVARSRDACYLRYLNGAAAVVYGIPVFLDS